MSLTRNIKNFAKGPFATRAPVIAGVFFTAALGTFVLAKIPAALSSTPPASIASTPETAALAAGGDAATAVNSCESQTWPYIDRNCGGEGAPGKSLVRVISPELSRTTVKTPERVAVAVGASEAPDRNPVAQAFSTLSTPNVFPTQQFVPVAAVRPDQVARTPKPVRSAEAKRPRQVAAVRGISRVERQPSRTDDAGIVARGDTYQVRRVYVQQVDIAHGLY